MVRDREEFLARLETHPQYIRRDVNELEPDVKPMREAVVKAEVNSMKKRGVVRAVVRAIHNNEREMDRLHREYDENWEINYKASTTMNPKLPLPKRSV